MTDRDEQREQQDTDGYEPMQGEKTVRDQLALHINDRFKYGYDPILVFFDGEWHYPLTPGETICGADIQYPVTAVRASEYTGPSTKVCSECGPKTSGNTLRGLRLRILTILDDGSENTSGFNRDALIPILERLERDERRKRGHDDAE